MQLLRFKEYLLKNKYYAFFFGMCIVLFLIIFFIATVAKRPMPKQPTVSIPTQQTNPDKGSALISSSPQISLDPQQQSLIQKQVDPQIKQLTPYPYSVKKIKPYTSTWATMTIVADGADAAHVVIRKEGDVWTVVLGPGTYFDSDQLKVIGAPQTLTNEINSDF